ncbi:Serine/threonine protein kinase [Nocardiopsis flavescens]|uniref:Serine/threonine protein kinase n=2 Tax=Nocardiopsis flavescens TaxID=758803 RepID=A0A1M6N9H8_9ACTN|nr:serine/threonine-protein kinase [Nocardiopsis flavescens]SHJ92314.1 Serine/threonine protein kinase [Nocardiopsis flavescens]
MRPLSPADPQRVGPHRLLARLGEGGMGRVYLARTPGGHLAALKAVREDLAHDRLFRARFDREVRVAGRVRGPFTPAVVDADTGADVPWMATEYVPGPTLKQAVLAGSPFPPDSLLVLTLGLTRALETIHGAGLIHRDLKPSNVLLSPRGPQVIDFGIARAVEGTVLTRTGQTLGTPAYTSPEQVVGEGVSPRSDVFSLGGTVLFAASGEPPFGPGPAFDVLRRVMSEAPYLTAAPDGPLRDILARCMAKDPSARPETADILAALSALPLPSAEHGWLPSPVTEQIDLHRGRTRSVEEAERTTEAMERPPAPLPGPGDAPAPGDGGPAPGGGRRRRRRVTAVSAAAAAVLLGGTALALALPDRGATGPGAGPPESASAGPSGDPSGAPPADGGSPLSGWIYDVVFSEDGETLYVFGMSGVSAWDWRGGELVRSLASPAPQAADLRPDGLTAVGYGLESGYVALWDAVTGEEVTRLGYDNGDLGFYDMPAFTSDGSRLAVLAAEGGTPEGDRLLQIWDTGTGEPAGVEIPVDGGLADLEFAVGDAYLVGVVSDWGEDPADVTVWDARTGATVYTLEGEAGVMGYTALSPDGRTMAVHNRDRLVRVVDVATGEVLRTMDAPDAAHERITGLGYSPGGDLLYGAAYGWSEDRGSVWDPATGALVRDADVPVYGPLAAHPDGEHLAVVADGGGRILILDGDYAVVGELV